jgi:hypothetical protein
LANLLSDLDRAFLDAFESGAIAPSEFDHKAHVRLAYVHLAGRDTEAALGAVRNALRRFLAHHGIDPAKYHETMTRAWVLAVRHFLERTPDSGSADDFIARNPALLDSQIMLSHYSADLLFSDAARARWVEPDLEDIPRHD